MEARIYNGTDRLVFLLGVNEIMSHCPSYDSISLGSSLSSIKIVDPPPFHMPKHVDGPGFRISASASQLPRYTRRNQIPRRFKR